MEQTHVHVTWNTPRYKAQKNDRVFCHCSPVRQGTKPLDWPASRVDGTKHTKHDTAVIEEAFGTGAGARAQLFSFSLSLVLSLLSFTHTHLLWHVEPRVDVCKEGYPLSAHLALLSKLLVNEPPDHGAADLSVDLNQKKKVENKRKGMKKAQKRLLVSCLPSGRCYEYTLHKYFEVVSQSFLNRVVG